MKTTFLFFIGFHCLFKNSKTKLFKYLIILFFGLNSLDFNLLEIFTSNVFAYIFSLIKHVLEILAKEKSKRKITGEQDE